MIEVKPPNKAPLTKRLFLAGSIEQGIADEWQKEIAEALSDLDVVILNPRRDHWNASLRQSSDEPEFFEQVDWELNMLDACDIIALYFQPGTMSPISLLELGLYASSRKLLVCCPPGFWRKGNVDIVCERFSIPHCTDKDLWIQWIRSKVGV